MDRVRFLQSMGKEKRFDATRRVIQIIDKIVKPLVIYSVAMLALECHLYPETDSHGSPWFFIWSERIVAGIFTLEYVFRFWRNSGKGYYPLTTFGVIDFIAIIPFWIGFVPFFGPYLHLIRTLRVMRMLKFFRYNRSLQLVALSFYRAWFNLKPLLFTTGMIVLFSMFALYEVEGTVQPEFRNLFTVAWFLEVTGTTVGYGDLSPQTTLGKTIVMGYMIAGLAVFMACFSAITNAFDKVFSEESDPNIDPLAQFKKVKEERKEIEQLTKDTGTIEAEDAEKEAAVDGTNYDHYNDDQFLADLEKMEKMG